jgi:hypothetical protein
MRKDLRTQKFGKLLVLSIHSKSRNSHIRYTCLCDCGKQTNVLGTHLIQGNTKSCGCDKPIGKTHHQWKGVEEISGDFWYSHVVRSANGDKGRRYPVKLTLTIEEAWNLFIRQERKCALSGLELSFPRVSKDKSYTASLDRIDSSKGYTIDNVQWVHKDINMMKNKFDNEYFINMCKKINIWNLQKKKLKH